MTDEHAVKLTDAIVRQSATSEQVATELARLRAVLAGTPHVIERVAGRPRSALVALIVVVSLSALVGSAVALAWGGP